MNKINLLSQIDILFPMLAMVVLTIVVAMIMYSRRVSTMKKHRIHPQKVQNRMQSLEQLTDTRASDNYLNLFEMPVLFYVSCITIFITSTASTLLTALSWAYFAFRVVHSFIHCGYNKVMHRFGAFILSAIVLLTIWVLIISNLTFGTTF